MDFIFYITTFCLLLILAGLGWSILYPKQRIWPPPSGRSWQFWVTWILTLLAWLGCHLVFFAHFSTSVLRLAMGLLLFIPGAGFALWGVYSLGTTNSLGLKDTMVSTGAYRYSRNPQYVGDAVLIAGMMIMNESERSMLVGLLATLSFLIAPFAEEPWLAAQYGHAYLDYKKQTNRFI